MMYRLGDFRIGNDGKWFMVVDKKGNVVRRFDLNKYEMDEIRLWREGYVRGLNAAQKA